MGELNSSSGFSNDDSISIVLCGQAGQGIQTVEFLLTRMLKLSGYNVFATKEYMSRVRGGVNSTEIRVSSRAVRALADRIDILVPLDEKAIGHLGKRITDETKIIGEQAVITGTAGWDVNNLIEVEFTKIATEIGSKIYSNIIAVGTILSFFEIDLETASSYMRRYFAGKDSEVVEKNVKAITAGYDIGRGICKSGRISINFERDECVEKHILLNGADAIGLGAIAGGCDFISSYPMSPSTGVLVFLASKGKEFGIIAEQAEDEISAINMAIGAWYAGARGMVTTSGGGFALMTEGLSLAGMLEVPVVVHLSQRPGPATGLPTRTEQGDIELAMYGGHGDFPRIILAPGSIEEGFWLMQKAFELADKFQVPVIVLTDQYFVDSYYNCEPFEMADVEVRKHVVETDADYKRYELTDSGVSPRGVPGYGKGYVCVDSDEHDQQGHITEDLELRKKMVDKRLKKYESIRRETVGPELIGNKKYKTLIICWGSTRDIICEAVKAMGRDDISILHFKQLHPLHESTADHLNRADKCVLIEGNSSGQFGKLIQLETGISIETRILKYNGLTFTVEEVIAELLKILEAK